MRSAGARSRSTRNRTAVGDVVDRRESPLLVVGVHEGSAKSAGTPHIRKEHGDPRVQQRREELVVAGPALTFGPAVQKDHRADRFDTRRWPEQPAGELQPVTGGDGFQARLGGDGPAAGLAVDRAPTRGSAGSTSSTVARHRRALDRHRHHRPAGADAQLAGHHAGQRNRFVQGVVGVLRESVIRWRR